MLIFLNVHYVLGMELTMLSISYIMRHCPQIAVKFINNECYVFDKETQKYHFSWCGGPLIILSSTLDKSRSMH